MLKIIHMNYLHCSGLFFTKKKKVKLILIIKRKFSSRHLNQLQWRTHTHSWYNFFFLIMKLVLVKWVIIKKTFKLSDHFSFFPTINWDFLSVFVTKQGSGPGNASVCTNAGHTAAAGRHCPTPRCRHIARPS